MNALDAAYAVLLEAGEPLYYVDLADRVLKSGLWQTEGKTPERTIEARIAVDIKKNGSSSRFLRTNKRTFAANPTAVGDPSTTPPSLARLVRPLTESTGETVAEGLSFADAAERVLEKYGRREPMHYREITRKALDSGLIVTKGQTPEATMYAQILTEIDKQEKSSVRPRFLKHGRGFVGLTQWQGTNLPSQIEEHNSAVRKQLHQRLREMKPAEFETRVSLLLTRLGFESVEVTPLAGDGGIDVRGTLVVADSVRIKMAVQVKRWKSNVLAPVIQQVRGSLGPHEQALVVTTGDFSEGARVEASRPDATPVALMNGQQLVSLLIQHEIGIKRASHILIELDEGNEINGMVD